MTTMAELMTPEPVSVGLYDTVMRAAELMDALNVGVLPVCLGTRLVGIVTDRDITVRATAAGLNAASTEIDMVISNRVRSCRPEHSAEDVLREMATVQIRRMPVVDAQDRLVGIISLGDLAARRPEGVQEALRRISTPAEPDRSVLVM